MGLKAAGRQSCDNAPPGKDDNNGETGNIGKF
jgi:hypothetical protein